MSRIADAIRFLNHLLIALILVLVYVFLFGLARILLLVERRKNGWQPVRPLDPETLSSPY